jgi:ABC-type transport system involved in multi-copper enzyme maturation permease subunit
MFKEFLIFELKYRLRQPMVYAFFVLFLFLSHSFTVETNIGIGGFGNLNNVNVNSPFKILAINSLLSLIGILMATAFMSGAALRDFKHNFSQIVFTTPVEKFGYLFGRYCGAVLIMLIPFLGAIFGSVTGTFLADPDKVGPFVVTAYLNSFLIFYLPNIILSGALFYSIAILTKNQTFAFSGTIFLLFGYAFTMILVQNLELQNLVYIFDPFGLEAAVLTTKYWTIAEKNTTMVSVSGWLLLNRSIWIAVSVVILALLYYFFSFTTAKAKRSGKLIKEEPTTFTTKLTYVNLSLPSVIIRHNIKTHIYQFLSQTKIEFFGIVRSPAFILITVFITFNLASSVIVAPDIFGVSDYLVTYRMLDIIRGTYLFGFFPVIVYYAGVLVWRERNANFSELNDASPFPSWVAFVSKTAGLIGMVALLCLLAIVICSIGQILNGYTNIEFGLYFKDVFLIEFTYFAMFCVLSMLFLTVINHRYLAYAALIVFLLVSQNKFDDWELMHNLYRFAEVPTYIYSDMYGFGPYAAGIINFKIYWLIFGALLVIIGSVFWVRGKTFGIKERFSLARKNLTSKTGFVFTFTILCLIGMGSWIYYNTNILNEYRTIYDDNKINAAYESTYKKTEFLPQPKVTDVKLNVDIFPDKRNVTISGHYIIKNKTEFSIDSVRVTTNPNWSVEDLDIPETKMVFEDRNLGYWIIGLQNSLQPGDSTQLSFKITMVSQGFENRISQNRILQNGTFLEYDILPHIGYNNHREVESKEERIKNGLTPYIDLPKVDDPKASMRNYIGFDSDWVTLQTILSTSSDQIAVAPGSLQKEWQEEGRRYFQYQLDSPSLKFFTFNSARYDIARDKWNDVDIEIYYHKPHDVNVHRMINSIKKTLAYGSENFSPYTHKQARIIEFPRFATFAQSFVGTMPCSESAGFIADLQDKDKIDMVFYIIAHEIGHQWWAHQVTGAGVQGETFLSETLAQYTAMMVMEQEYGREKMHKYLRYEMDKYLRGRGRESKKEMPLSNNENQGYIHYNKGGVTMYALRDYIGEAKVNLALKRFVEAHAYSNPPYPTSRDLMKQFRAVTPDSLQSMLYDMFESITLFSNRVSDASYRQLDNGKYLLYLTVECNKFRADSIGVETEIPVDDWIDIGVYAKGSEERSKPIYFVRQKINQPKMELKIELDTEPGRAGIDPNFLLIDRFPEDNIKTTKSLDKEFDRKLNKL